MAAADSPTAIVRDATADAAAVVAGLRWTCRTDEEDETGPVREDFVEGFTGWFVEHLDSHHPIVALVADQVVGMAFVAAVERLPGVRAWSRRSDHLQSVFVLPINAETASVRRSPSGQSPSPASRGLTASRSIRAHRRSGCTGERASARAGTCSSSGSGTVRLLVGRTATSGR